MLNLSNEPLIAADTTFQPINISQQDNTDILNFASTVAQAQNVTPNKRVIKKKKAVIGSRVGVLEQQNGEMIKRMLKIQG